MEAETGEEVKAVEAMAAVMAEETEVVVMAAAARVGVKVEEMEGEGTVAAEKVGATVVEMGAVMGEEGRVITLVGFGFGVLVV